MTTRSLVRATPAERAQDLAGDHLIPNAFVSLTDAVTTGCRRQDLWPWLAQMGAGRAGWYSYDTIDNGGQPSAEEVLPQFQTIAVGTVLPALPRATDAFIVAEIEPEHFLVLGWPSEDGNYLSTWAFTLEEVAPDKTRLIVRGRAGPGYHFHGLPLWLLKPAARRAEQPIRHT